MLVNFERCSIELSTSVFGQWGIGQSQQLHAARCLNYYPGAKLWDVFSIRHDRCGETPLVYPFQEIKKKRETGKKIRLYNRWGTWDMTCMSVIIL
ncbi:hypothetical protein AVEN_110286-1 [Araneus ventricosus]|uniref:Uncharacterized protein n=1 Tax=Araneus ventricosus TaxID=182803 RepID=A0A4Y2DP57_ARAVE|nr:hypothetical protein AVEN_110286-1 [Araneus ventricosus]